jgi:hypothetical protein
MNADKCDHGYLPTFCAWCWRTVEYVVKAPEPVKPRREFKPLPTFKGWTP